MNKKIILSLVSFALLTLAPVAYADSALVSVLPSLANKAAGTNFTLSVGVNPMGNNVCVVKGTVHFTGLTCQSISVASGLMAQTTPTCSSPSFTIGIPSCTTSVQNILSVLVRGSAAGQGSVFVGEAKVIGVGVDVPFSAQAGSYQITVAAPVVKAPVAKVVSKKPVVAESSDAQKEAAPVENSEIQIPQEAGAAALATSTQPSANTWWVIGLILAAILCGGYYFVKNRKKKV